jgi:hypothetical protein
MGRLAEGIQTKAPGWVVVGKRSTTTRWETHGKSNPVPLSLLAAPLSVVCGWGKWVG